MLSLGSDVECVEFVLRALDGSDDLAVELLPVGDLAI